MDLANINTVIEMAVFEEDNDVLEVILERVIAEKDTKEIICACEKLSISNAWRIRMFVAKIADINVIIKMAIIEEDYNVLEIILERLETIENVQEIIDFCNELTKAKSWKIRKFIAKIAQINIVFEMTITEKNSYVLETILERLE